MSQVVSGGEDDLMGSKQFYHRVSALAHQFKQQGMKPKQRVLITAKPSVDFYCIAIAVWTTGTVPLVELFWGNTANVSVALADV